MARPPGHWQPHRPGDRRSAVRPRPWPPVNQHPAGLWSGRTSSAAGPAQRS